MRLSLGCSALILSATALVVDAQHHPFATEFGRANDYRHPMASWQRKRNTNDLGTQPLIQLKGSTTMDSKQAPIISEATSLTSLEEIQARLLEDLWFENSLSLSMSVSTGSEDETGGGSSPSAPSTGSSTPSPVTSPSGPTPATTPPTLPTTTTTRPTALATMSPSFDTSTLEPTASPTTAPTGSLSPTFTRAPTSSPTDVPLVADCINNGIVFSETSDPDSMTLLSLTVGYAAESTSNNTDDFVVELELALLDTAMRAGLRDCDVRRRGLRSDASLNHNGRRHLTQVGTTFVDDCDATLNETEACTILETDLMFWVYTSAIDSVDEALFAAYTAIQTHMDEDLYIGEIPTVLLLEYLSPLPIPLPESGGQNGTLVPGLDSPGGNSGSDPIDTSVTPSGLNLSPWTIGACVATLMGAILSLSIWSRRSARRRRRHNFARTSPAFASGHHACLEEILDDDSDCGRHAISIVRNVGQEGRVMGVV